MRSIVKRTEQMILDNFRANLKVLCHGRQGKVAEAAGLCARQHLNEIISGKYSPSLATAAKIAIALDIELSDLLRPHDEFLADLEKSGKITKKYVYVD